MKQHYKLDLESARAVIAAAEAEAARNNWNVAIAVVDEGGHLVAFVRRDDTQTASLDICIAKARSAAGFKRPTLQLHEQLVGGRMALLSLPHAMPVEGGVPLYFHGDLVGAVGVSGVKSDEDGQVARAGAAVLDGR